MNCSNFNIVLSVTYQCYLKLNIGCLSQHCSYYLNYPAFMPRILNPEPILTFLSGVNFLVAGYAYSAGGVLFDPAVPLDNANIKIHGSVFAYARSIKVGRYVR